jgi:formylglycine-generating enzyme required for sulfatase activity
MNDDPSYFGSESDQLPVEQVDWHQAGDYCKAIGGRLPTEKEWEYAARAGVTGARYGPLDAVAWYDNNSGGTTHPGGLKQRMGSDFMTCSETCGSGRSTTTTWQDSTK